LLARRRGRSIGAMPEPLPIREPDVYLDVPEVKVDEIKLDLDRLVAHLALEARLANLLELRAGAHVAIEDLQLDIKGVAAKARLEVRLDNVRAILDRALQTVDRNVRVISDRGVGVRPPRIRPPRLRAPVLGRRLVTPVATAVGLVGGAAIAAHSNGGVEKTLKELTS
jgi:hypothetical protein